MTSRRATAFKTKLLSDLTIDDQVSTVFRSCNYNIRQLRAVRSTLSRDALRDAVYTVVLSRLDYCNSLNANTQVTQMRRLQMIINIVVRVVSGCRPFNPYELTSSNVSVIGNLLSNVFNLTSAQWHSRLFTKSRQITFQN